MQMGERGWIFYIRKTVIGHIIVININQNKISEKSKLSGVKRRPPLPSFGGWPNLRDSFRLL